MKIAGRKNDGAWFRTNKVLQTLTESEKSQLVAHLGNRMTFLDLYFNDVLALASQTGVYIDTAPTTSAEFLQNLINVGIPRQVWMGRMTFTTYSKVGTGDQAEYVPNYQANAGAFGNELRGYMKQWLYARRQMRDVLQRGGPSDGNPGGIADAAIGN